MEQGYKKKLLQGDHSRIGEWQDIKSEDEDDFRYFTGEPDQEYANKMKEILGIDDDDDEEEEGELDSSEDDHPMSS